MPVEDYCPPGGCNSNSCDPITGYQLRSASLPPGRCIASAIMAPVRVPQKQDFFFHEQPGDCYMPYWDPVLESTPASHQVRSMHAGPPILSRVDLKLPPGSRMLLVGGNGAGKTTLLQILAGKHMVPQVRVIVSFWCSLARLCMTCTACWTLVTKALRHLTYCNQSSRLNMPLNH